MSDGQTPRAAGDAAWSDGHAETGGWPPPGPDQRRYEPGVPPVAGRPDDRPVPGGYAGGRPGTGPPDPGGHPADRPGQPDPGTPGAARPVPGGPGNGPGPGGYGPDGPGYGGYGPGGPGYGPGAPTGGPAPWAPGDSAYGRLGGPAAPQPPATPRRTPARRPRTTGGTQVTIGLIVACVLAYLVQQADQTVTYRFGLLPIAVTEGGDYHRLITAAFLHAGLLHLATNMLTLYIVGAPLERVLGPARYLTIYLISALGGSLLSLALSPAYSIGVGASGAIFGLFGALVVLRRQVGAEAGGLYVLIGLNLVISFTLPNISWQAHIGGLVTGAVVALALLPTLRARRH